MSSEYYRKKLSLRSVALSKNVTWGYVTKHGAISVARFYDLILTGQENCLGYVWWMNEYCIWFYLVLGKAVTYCNLKKTNIKFRFLFMKVVKYNICSKGVHHYSWNGQLKCAWRYHLWINAYCFQGIYLLIYLFFTS